MGSTARSRASTDLEDRAVGVRDRENHNLATACLLVLHAVFGELHRHQRAADWTTKHAVQLSHTLRNEGARGRVARAGSRRCAGPGSDGGFPTSFAPLRFSASRAKAVFKLRNVTREISSTTCSASTERWLMNNVLPSRSRHTKAWSRCKKKAKKIKNNETGRVLCRERALRALTHEHDHGDSALVHGPAARTPGGGAQGCSSGLKPGSRPA